MSLFKWRINVVTFMFIKYTFLTCSRHTKVCIQSNLLKPTANPVSLLGCSKAKTKLPEFVAHL